MDSLAAGEETRPKAKTSTGDRMVFSLTSPQKTPAAEQMRAHNLIIPITASQISNNS